MNTRIQVEHPVTEMISGVDIVKEQILMAAGHPLSLEQWQVTLSGHAIECRLTAEDAERDFIPSPGKILQWVCPEGPDIRVDTHCFPGYSVPPFYDSLLAKVITKGKDRPEAIEQMKYALGNMVVTGVKTSIPFLLYILNHDDYRRADMHTKWMEALLEAYSNSASKQTGS
jgi:acetyl-CoA carboxylase biotin carboxylase subunit